MKTENKRIKERRPHLPHPQASALPANEERRTVRTLVLPFAELPFEGVDLDASEEFVSLLHRDEVSSFEDIQAFFTHPIRVRGSLTPVGAKVDIRADFHTQIRESCDRCTTDFETDIEGDLSTFLMPEAQFSEHDKPGGKVIHSATRDQKRSRHHSASKAPVLTDAEGEHEDIRFGAYDGDIIDLRGLLREQLILNLPLRALCSESCPGLCLSCGENIARKECRCPQGPQPVVEEENAERPLSDFQKALKKRFKDG